MRKTKILRLFWGLSPNVGGGAGVAIAKPSETVWDEGIKISEFFGGNIPKRHQNSGRGKETRGYLPQYFVPFTVFK